jgi:hypothetical protein
MNKEARKKLEANIISSIEQAISKESHAVVVQMRKLVKATGKKIAKKFFKTVKSAEKKAAKQKKKSPSRKPRSKKPASSSKKK